MPENTSNPKAFLFYSEINVKHREFVTEVYDQGCISFL